MHSPESWNLERRGGGLFWDGCDLTELAQLHATPLYVINTALLRRSYEDLRGAFQAVGLSTRLFFSYKTNPVPDVLTSLAALGCGAETISEFELWLAEKIGVQGRDTVVNGSVKSHTMLRMAAQRDVAAIHVESTDEIRLLRVIASDLSRPLNIGLRINPCLAKSRFDFTLAAGSRTSHIGFAPASSDWKNALELLRDSPGLRLRGLHFHVGTGVRSARPYQLAMRTALSMWSELLERGFRPEVLDIGGGFSTPTLREFNLLEAACLFGFGRPPRQAAGQARNSLVGEVARVCSAALREFTRAHGIDMPTVYVEPGRALVSSSQLLLLRVVMIKKRVSGADVAVCDAGAMSLSPQLLSEPHAILVANKPAGGRTAKYDLMGNLPAPLDWIGLRQELPILEPGDILAVMDVGAYFTSLGNNFAGPRPAIAIIDKGVPRLARRREAFEDMVSRDVSLQSTGTVEGRQSNDRT